MPPSKRRSTTGISDRPAKKIKLVHEHAVIANNIPAKEECSEYATAKGGSSTHFTPMPSLMSEVMSFIRRAISAKEPSKRRSTTGISDRPARKIKLVHEHAVIANNIPAKEECSEYATAKGGSSTHFTPMPSLMSEVMSFIRRAIRAKELDESAIPKESARDIKPSLVSKIVSFVRQSLAALRPQQTTTLQSTVPLTEAPLPAVHSPVSEECASQSAEDIPLLLPLQSPSWLDEFTAALQMTAPFNTRAHLSLRVFDLLPYSDARRRGVWLEHKTTTNDATRLDMGVVDELGNHYWVTYYHPEHQQQAQHEIHMNQLLREHCVPHVITALCNVALSSGIVCIVFPHHVPSIMLRHYYLPGSTPPFKLTCEDLYDGMRDILRTLRAVRWNTDETRHRGLKKQPLEFCYGRFVDSVMLVPNDQTGRIEFKLFAFRESCARIGEREYAAPQLDWRTVPYKQSLDFLADIEIIAEEIGAQKVLQSREITESCMYLH